MTRARRLSLTATLLLTGALTVSTARADAPGDAWAAAGGVVPASTQILVGLNINTIKTSSLFQQLYPKMLSAAGAAGEVDELKASCGLDVKDALQGVVIALDENQKGVVCVSLKGVDQGKALTCMNKAGEKEKKSFLATKPDAQGIVEYTEKGSKEKVFVAWLPKGVVAISTEQGDKNMLKRWLSGKGPDAKLNAVVGKVNTAAALWGVVGKPQQLEPGMDMKAGYGQADLTGGNINADLRLVLANAKQATEAAGKGQKQLEEARKSGGLPPAIAAVLSTVKINSAGDELQIKASMAEKEALGLIGMAMGQ
jgi:hypothetical protein